MDERAHRIGLNEAVFREVNEQIRGLSDRFGLEERTLDLICECGRPDCTERITMSVDDYERVRSDGALFAVIPGHDDDDGAEDVVERAGGYEIVRKRAGHPAELARQTDPRA